MSSPRHAASELGRDGVDGHLGAFGEQIGDEQVAPGQRGLRALGA